MITNEQLDELKAIVLQLVADKADADAKTLASNKADTEAAQANAQATQAKLEEAAADTLVTTAVTDLRSFIDTLNAPPTEGPAPTGAQQNAIR